MIDDDFWTANSEVYAMRLRCDACSSLGLALFSTVCAALSFPPCVLSDGLSHGFNLTKYDTNYSSNVHVRICDIYIYMYTYYWASGLRRKPSSAWCDLLTAVLGFDEKRLWKDT